MKLYRPRHLTCVICPMKTAQVRLDKLQSRCCFKILATVKKRSNIVVQGKTRCKTIKHPEKQNLWVGRGGQWKKPEDRGYAMIFNFASQSFYDKIVIFYNTDKCFLLKIKGL